MKISSVEVHKLNNDSSVKAICKIIFNDVLLIRGIRIIERNDGSLFAAMPSRKKQSGEYEDLAHPIKADLRQELEKVLIEEYNRINISENAIS